jgi:hypothetical protein
MEKKKRKKGAQPLNRNARKHGFYSKFLDKDEKALLQKAATVEGLDEEIAVLRLKLQQILTDHPDRADLAFEAGNTIARLVRTRHQTTKAQNNALKDAFEKVITDIAVPLGIKFLIK